MKTALEHYGALYPGAKDFVPAIQRWLLTIPDRRVEPDGDGLWTCHALARAVKWKWGLIQWRVADGFFARVGQNHSWLTTLAWDTQLVLDVYPVAGFGGPLLVDISSHGSPWCELYLERPDFYSENHRTEWRKDAEEIVALSKNL